MVIIDGESRENKKENSAVMKRERRRGGGYCLNKLT